MSPDARQHRGPHPEDASLFDADLIPALRQATAELSWLLSRDYPLPSSLKLVGDRHRLAERQRAAVGRAACSDRQLKRRSSTYKPIRDLKAEPLEIDGFNLLITVEAALSGAVLILCRDGCIRDLSSVHGSYRSVEETQKAIDLIGEMMEPIGPARVNWLLDQPVSNSGRLAQTIKDTAAEHGWPWSVELAFNPDSKMIESTSVAITSDSLVLDRAARWANLARHLIGQSIPESWVIDLAAVAEGATR